jgi:flagellar biosynthesis/type III secretory pathway protein FliH
MGSNPLERRRDLVERLRKNGNAGVDGDTAFEAAGEIESCMVALENEARKLKSWEKAGDTLNKTITGLQAAIVGRDAEIERLKADTAAIVQALQRGFRQGYRAAAAQFSGIVYQLVQMTVPIGQEHQEHHHHGP